MTSQDRSETGNGTQTPHRALSVAIRPAATRRSGQR